jgi:excinuclease ABC subunit C
MADLGVDDIAVVGVAKGPDRDAGLERFFIPGKPPFMLEPKSPVLYYLQRLRDEAHRFGLTYHRNLRGKRQSRSALDDIPGIGTRRRQELLKHFGSLDRMKQASAEELARAPGMNRPAAQKLYEALHA